MTLVFEKARFILSTVFNMEKKVANLFVIPIEVQEKEEAGKP